LNVSEFIQASGQIIKGFRGTADFIRGGTEMSGQAMEAITRSGLDATNYIVDFDWKY
jgi:hypothetical protein